MLLLVRVALNLGKYFALQETAYTERQIFLCDNDLQSQSDS